MKIKRIRQSKKKVTRKTQLAILATSMSFPVLAYAAVAVTFPVATQQITQVTSQTLQTSSTSTAGTIQKITTDMTKFTTDHTKRIWDNTNEIVSAIAVATKQESLSAQALAESNTKSTQMLNTAAEAVQKQTLTIEAHRKYGPDGQGYGACKVYAENASMDKATNAVDRNAAELESTTLSTTLTNPDAHSAQEERVRIQREEFCPGNITNPGSLTSVCTPSHLPAGDTDASVFMGTAEMGSKEQLAKKMFREHILSAPTPALTSRTAVDSPEGQEHFYQINRQAALMGPANHSLAYIDAQNLRSIERDGKMYSANELIDQTVSRYYGGPEAKKWQAQMLSQEPRGLLVEAARIGGVGTWMANRSYKQNLRMEANLAAILLTTAEPIAKDVRQQSSQLEKQRVLDSITVYR